MRQIVKGYVITPLLKEGEQAEYIFKCQCLNDAKVFYSKKYTDQKRIYRALIWCPKFINQVSMERYIVIGWFWPEGHGETQTKQNRLSYSTHLS